MSERKTYTAFDKTLLVYKPDDLWPFHPYPWRFKIFDGYRWLTYAGIPNQCKTQRSAYKRAWWKAKKMSH